MSLPMLMWLFLVQVAASADKSAVTIEVPGVVVSVIDQVEVPAREQGPLTAFAVEEGDTVEAGGLLASTDDGDARLAVTRASLELEAAREEANNRVKVELAEKSLKLAESELARGRRARERFPESISDEEMEDRELRVERARLEIKQALHELTLAGQRCRARENDLLLAQRRLELHRIVAPLSGVVVQVNRRPGEWVEPGDPVVKILHLRRLRAEGYLKASESAMELAGKPVELLVETSSGQRVFTGVLRFVSPEINPVDGKLRVWAEVDNTDLTLRPGMRGVLRIDPAATTDAR